MKIDETNKIDRNNNHENGQALIISVLCMTCLLGFTALAADVGVMLHVKRVTQTAADAAAIAATAELAYPTKMDPVGKAAAAQNGISDGVNGATVAIHNGPSLGPHIGDKSYVEAIVTQVQPTIFMALFGKTSMTVAARAVAAYGTTQSCIVTLGTSGPDISIVGNASITVQTCGVADNSLSPASAGKKAALYLQGSATLDAQSIGVTGGYAVTGGSGGSGPFPDAQPVTGVVPTSDPLATKPMPPLPPTGCTNTPSFGTQSTLNLSAGCYNGISIGSGQTVQLSSGGLYYINGDLNLQAGSTLSGTGVTIVLLGATNIQGTPTLTLSAPQDDTNPYDGLLFYQPPSNTNTLNLIGNASSSLDGIVYAPNAPVQLQGNAGAKIYVDFVVKTLTLQGNATLNDYAKINPSDILSTVRLVE